MRFLKDSAYIAIQNEIILIVSQDAPTDREINMYLIQ
jgi:hypothetical protein